MTDESQITSDELPIVRAARVFVGVWPAPAHLPTDSLLEDTLRRQSLEFGHSLGIGHWALGILPHLTSAWLYLRFGSSALCAAEGPTSPLPRPLRTELHPSFWAQHGGMIMLAAILTVGVVGLCIWRLRRPKPIIVIPPEALARSALESLRGRTEDGALVSDVSRIFRHYVISTFQLPPDELTTGELQKALQPPAHANAELVDGIIDFLRACDEWKFAPLRSGAGGTPAPLTVAGALELIGKIEARRKPPLKLVTA